MYTIFFYTIIIPLPRDLSFFYWDFNQLHFCFFQTAFDRVRLIRQFADMPDDYSTDV